MTPPSKARESVRRRLGYLAKFAVVLAVPVTNTACDPAPDPYCDTDPGQWGEKVQASAVWATDPDGKGLIIDLEVSIEYPIYYSDVVITGGSAVEDDTAAGRLPTQIRPDKGASEIVITGSLQCSSSSISTPMTLTLDLGGAPTEGGVVPVAVAVTG